MFSALENNSEAARQFLTRLVEEHEVFFQWFTAFARILTALVILAVVVRIAFSLLRGGKQPETWGYLNLANGLKIPINHWENLIGRAKNCDVVMNFPTVSRNHAVLMRRDDGKWRLIDLSSKTGLAVNGEEVKNETVIDYWDIIDVGGVKAQFSALSEVERTMEELREVPGTEIKPALTMILLTVLNALLALQLTAANPGDFIPAVPLSFVLMTGLIWVYYFLVRAMRRRGFEVEQTAFLLSSVSLSVVAGSDPQGVLKQFLAITIGLCAFMALGWFLRDLRRANAMRWPMGAAAIGLLLLTMVAGTVVYGAKNWIFIGGFSIQPSELAKLCFIYAGTATLDRLFAKRNLIMYMALTVCIGGALAYTGDFGAALIFFAGFLVVAFMRSGDFATLSLITLGVLLGGMLLLKFKPYVAYRFESWRHAWEVPHDGGFQQSRTMSASASGRFFGVGAGRGWLKDIIAADTDLVFGVVSEELGLIAALCCVAAVTVLAVYSFSSAFSARSTFYAISACAATSMMMFQMMLNVLGPLDILPLTGVTFPFVSNGGSSIISCFGMLAFVKAADIRRRSSFAAKNEAAFSEVG